ncbi:MAG: hypothetical protein QF724_01135 [Planctomycetota bacterium]|nr:hypothetical protein [Planctomycetota bacterium]MDP6955446.1 hypothetical protein [Planctomycetota bacterium]
MQYHIVMIPAVGSPELEEELNAFLRSHRVVHVARQLELVDNCPSWLFCVEWLEGSPMAGPKPGLRAKRVDYKDVLSEDDFAVFAALRDKRKELASAKERREASAGARQLERERRAA